MAGCSALGAGVPSLWSACSLYTPLPYGYGYRMEGVGRRGRPGGEEEYYQEYQGSYGEYYEDQFYYYDDYYEDYDKNETMEVEEKVQETEFDQSTVLENILEILKQNMGLLGSPEEDEEEKEEGGRGVVGGYRRQRRPVQRNPQSVFRGEGWRRQDEEGRRSQEEETQEEGESRRRDWAVRGEEGERRWEEGGQVMRDRWDEDDRWDEGGQRRDGWEDEGQRRWDGGEQGWRREEDSQQSGEKEGEGDGLLASGAGLLASAGFFGVLLPGVLGTLLYLGVPVAQVAWLN